MGWFGTLLLGLMSVQAMTLSSYNTWAADLAQNMATVAANGPLDDRNGGGISNLMKFALGGAPMVSFQAILPARSKLIGVWILECNRSTAFRPSTIQTLEHGSNLTGWNSVNIPPVTTGMFQNTYAISFDRMKITVPINGNQNFLCLKITQ